MRMNPDEKEYHIKMIREVTAPILERVEKLEMANQNSGGDSPLSLWKLLRKHGVGLYTTQMICNEAMHDGVSLPVSRPQRGSHD